MAKSQLFKRPMQFIYTHGGVFPVRRGHRDEEAFKTAHAILARGDIVVMYAEGGRSRSGELGEPKPGARPARARVGRAGGADRDRRAPRRRATGSGSSSRRSPCCTASRCASSRSTSRTREQEQAASEIVFEDVRVIHGRLRKEGRRGAIQAARAARRAAEGAGRRPISAD